MTPGPARPAMVSTRRRAEREFRELALASAASPFRSLAVCCLAAGCCALGSDSAGRARAAVLAAGFGVVEAGLYHRDGRGVFSSVDQFW